MNTIQAMVLTLKSKWKPRFEYSFEKLKQMFSFSVWSLFESIAIWLTSYIGTFIVGRLLTPYYLGLYRTSITTINSFLAIITSALLPVMFSALSRCQDDNEQFNKVYFDFQKLISIISIPMGVGIFLFSDLVTMILLGSQWMEASRFIGIYGLVSNITIFTINISGNVYRSKGRPKVSFVAQMIYLFMMTPTIYYAALVGYDELCIMRVLIAIPYLVLTLMIQQFLFGIHIVDIAKNIFPQVFSAIIMAAFGIIMKIISSNIAWQFVTIFLCVIIYLGTIMCFPSTRRIVLENKLVKNIIKKIK
jgi:PST family polysaccharide transporter